MRTSRYQVKSDVILIPRNPPNWIREKWAEELFSAYSSPMKWKNLDRNARKDWVKYVDDVYDLVYRTYSNKDYRLSPKDVKKPVKEAKETK